MGTLWPFINSLVYPQHVHGVFRIKIALSTQNLALRPKKKRSSPQFEWDFVPEFDWRPKKRSPQLGVDASHYILSIAVLVVMYPLKRRKEPLRVHVPLYPLFEKHYSIAYPIVVFLQFDSFKKKNPSKKRLWVSNSKYHIVNPSWNRLGLRANENEESNVSWEQWWLNLE